MPRQIVMDHTGHTCHEFDVKNVVGLKEAEDRFRELTGVGFIAAARSESGEANVIRKFDPTVEETIFIPRLQGG